MGNRVLNWIDEMIDPGIKQHKRVAAFPSLEFRIEIGTHQMACYGGDREWGQAIMVWHVVREIIIFYPGWMSSVPLGFKGVSSR